MIKFFYSLKPVIPRYLQIGLRRILIKKKLNRYKDIWPIDPKAGVKPNGWRGWPDNKNFALILTHDVDTSKGQEGCLDLIQAEQTLGFKSSFNFVPERYKVDDKLLKQIANKCFEVGVHGLNHDGKLYSSKKVFLERAAKINQYIKNWGAVGFRSPAMHHNLDWLHNLNIKYDSSTFDTDPFEPQPTAAGTIFPFWVRDHSKSQGYLELPYTLAQDFTLFIILKEKKIDIWKRKLDWIAARGGMALLNTHPDYINFDYKKLGLEEYPIKYYVDFLKYVLIQYKGQFWHALPKELVRFFEP